MSEIFQCYSNFGFAFFIKEEKNEKIILKTVALSSTNNPS